MTLKTPKVLGDLRRAMRSLLTRDTPSLASPTFLGVAARHKSLEDALAEQEYTLNLFPLIETILFCPDYEGMVCYRVWRKFAGFDLDACNREEFDYPSFRKPGAGMLILGMELCSAERHDCLYVGDRPEDETAAEKAGVRFLWAADWIDQAGRSE